MDIGISLTAIREKGNMNTLLKIERDSDLCHLWWRKGDGEFCNVGEHFIFTMKEGSRSMGGMAIGFLIAKGWTRSRAVGQFWSKFDEIESGAKSVVYFSSDDQRMKETPIPGVRAKRTALAYLNHLLACKWMITLDDELMAFAKDAGYANILANEIAKDKNALVLQWAKEDDDVSE